MKFEPEPGLKILETYVGVYISVSVKINEII